jgi:hypothetical protein
VSRRVVRGHYGVVSRIGPRETGALACCRFCEWGHFAKDNKRKKWSAMARAAASLRAHTKKNHADKLPKLFIPVVA